MRLTTVAVAVVASVLLMGCGNSQPTAQVKAACPPGQTLISGHFHGEYCVAQAKTAVATICRETQYALNVVIDSTLRDLQPAFIQVQFERAARESAAILEGAMKALRSTHEAALEELKWVSLHRTRLVAYASAVRRVHDVRHHFGGWFKGLVTIDLGCEPFSGVPWPRG